MIRRYSELSPEAEIQNWFGNSKIVDDKGRPKILYHGGTKWDSFKTEGYFGGAFWATEDPFVADSYAERYESGKSEIKPIIMKAVNPLDLREPHTLNEFFGEDLTRGPFSNIEKNMAMNIPKESKEMLDKARIRGYDAIIHYDTDALNRGLHTSYISLIPGNVRMVSDTDFGETQTRFRK